MLDLRTICFSSSNVALSSEIASPSRGRRLIMELKPYQKTVIADLTRYLQLLNEERSTSKAYTAL